MSKALKNKVKLNGFVNVIEHGADPTGTNDSSGAFTTALGVNKKIYVPQGAYRFNSAVVLPNGANVKGDGVLSAIRAYGVSAFSIAAGGSFVTIDDLTVSSFSAGGAADPRTQTGITVNGTNGNNVNYVSIKNLYMQGWDRAIYFGYTWNSRVENVTTINTNDGLYSFGQTVNNSVTGCRLVVNGGNASINLQPDGSIIGEGLMVSDSLLSSGTYGILCGTGYLSLHVSNCVIDLITGDAIRSTDCKDLRVSNSWLYAANTGIRQQALGSASNVGASITGNTIQVTSSTGYGVFQGGANVGASIIGNHFKNSGTSNSVYLDGQSAVVDGNYFENAGSGVSIVVNGSATTHKIGKNTGVATVSGLFGTPEYTEGSWTVTDASGAGLSITNNSTATYVKHGKQVTCHLDITYPATANASVARLSLPFQPDAGSAPAGSVAVQQPITFQVNPNASTAAANFTFWRPGTQAFATNADLTGARLQVTFNYRANA